MKWFAFAIRKRKPKWMHVVFQVVENTDAKVYQGLYRQGEGGVQVEGEECRWMEKGADARVVSRVCLSD
jgi:hypothetical protein